MILQIPEDMLNDMPASVWEGVMEAMDYGQGELSIPVLLSKLDEGDNQLWLQYDEKPSQFNSVIITSIVEYPCKRVCEIQYLGGNSMGDLKDLEGIEGWAKHNNCDDIRVTGRKGWKKILQNQGYNEWYTVLGKKL